MRGELVLPPAALTAFLLVMARVGGAMVFLPMPGFRNGPSLARMVFAAGTSLTLLPFWPRQAFQNMEALRFLGALLSEAMFGLAIGLLVAFLAEILVMGAQIVSVQAGYSYAMTVDPMTQAEAGYLVIFSQLLSGFLFFSMGLDRAVLRAFFRSLQTVPPGTFELTRPQLEMLLRSAGSIFSTGMRLVLPVVALLAMTDILLALMGRLNAQLQVMTIAFSAKMLMALGLLGYILALYPNVFGEAVNRTIESIYTLIR